MELSSFGPAFIFDENLKINRSKVGIDPNRKDRMSVHQYVSYEDLYDTATNVEREMKEKNEYYNELWGNNREGS